MSAPAQSGTLDFDLLDDVVGEGCASWSDQDWFSVSLAGVSLGNAFEGDGLVARAEAAAAFDALAKMKGADTLLVTRIYSDTKGDKTCATIYGRGVRLKKGPSIAPQSAVRPASEAGERPAAIPHEAAAPAHEPPPAKPK